MKNLNGIYSNPKQGFLPVFLSDYLDLLDPVFTFDRFMEGIDLQKYLKSIPRRTPYRLHWYRSLEEVLQNVNIVSS